MGVLGEVPTRRLLRSARAQEGWDRTRRWPSEHALDGGGTRPGRWARLPPIRPHPSVRFQPGVAPPPPLVIGQSVHPASPILVGAACPSVRSGRGCRASRSSPSCRRHRGRPRSCARRDGLTFARGSCGYAAPPGPSSATALRSPPLRRSSPARRSIAAHTRVAAVAPAGEPEPRRSSPDRRSLPERRSRRRALSRSPSSHRPRPRTSATASTSVVHTPVRPP